MSISASQVKELREISGAGMMDCKAALTETNGDMEAAVDWLRAKGISKADKKAGRTAAEGLVGVATNGKKSVIVEVNSETDFVARNDAFQDIGRNVATVARGSDGSTAAVAAATYPATGKSVVDTIKDAVGTIGENLSFRRSAALSVGEGVVATYIHMGGKVGVLVEVATNEAGKENEEVKQFAHDLSLQIAAAKPEAVRREEVDSEKLEKEREIQRAKALEAGKPEKIVDRIVDGQIEKYYKEVCLLDQQFVKDPDKTIKGLMAEVSKAAGAPVDVVRFARFERGEGIEKRKDDLAAEIAAMQKA